MDERCRNALMDMKFDDSIVNIFKETKIDYSALLLLNEYPDMIPPDLCLGDKLKLRKGVQSLIEAQMLPVPIVSLTSSSSSSRCSVVHSDQASLSSIEVNDSPSTLLLDDVITLEVVDGDALQPSKRARLEQGTTETGTTHVEVADSAVEERQPTNNFLLDLLNKTVLGKALIKTHQVRGFDNNSRCKLAELVINAEFGDNLDTEIHCKRFEALSKFISEAFPGESAETYYISSYSRGKGRAATGKLYDAYTNINKELRKLGLRATHTAPSTALCGNGGLNASLPPAPPAGDPAISRALQFLTVYVEPWDLVRQNWEVSRSARLHSLRDPNSEEFPLVSDYITRYPALTQPGGHSLLEEDFKVLFPEAADRMITHWTEFASKLKAQLIQIGIKDSLETDTELLYNFPRLFSVIPVKIKAPRTKVKPWRASRAEIQEGFMVHIKVIGDLEKKIEGMKKTIQARGTKLQPFPLIVGETLSNISSSYVIVDDRPIRVENPRRAVEVAFKIFHALYCDYPVQSERLWIVLQKALFGINEDWESNVKTLPEVLRLISTLKCVD